MRHIYLSILVACSGPKLVEDLDGDGFPTEQDCDDYNASIHPNAPEICDGIDNNCNEQIDMQDPSLTDGQEGFLDLDEDGFGAGEEGVYCSTTSINRDDCDDNNPQINPFANEYCNNQDDNCNELIDDNALDSVQLFFDGDGDGFGSTISFQWGCPPMEGYAQEGGDCNDNSSTQNPAAEELCDGIDNDCDGSIDDNDDSLILADTEIYYFDGDGDGYGDPAQSFSFCTPPSEEYVLNADDCDDNLYYVNPGIQYDGCNTIDEDCDGSIDEDVKSGWQLLSIDTNAGFIYAINPTNADTSSIGAISGNFKINSMDVSESGTSIVHDHQNKRLWELNVCTGDMTALPTSNPTISTCGIAFGPYNKFYGLDTSNDQLVEYNTQTGEATAIGPLGIPIGSCGLTYDCSEDRLIGANATTGEIFTIDPNTGQAYDVVQTQVPFQSVGVEFDHGTGLLLASTKTELYSVDVHNGTTTLLGPLGGSNIDDLAYYPQCP